jgi:hypothetical protein
VTKGKVDVSELSDVKLVYSRKRYTRLVEVGEDLLVWTTDCLHMEQNNP